MLKSYYGSFVRPGGDEPLVFKAFDEQGNGVLHSNDSSCVVPVESGVPLFVNGLTSSFASAFAPELMKLGAQIPKSDLNSSDSWSFSREWDEHFDSANERTWGYTVQERYEQLLMECQVTENELKSMSVLDAGCGNGSLTDYIGDKCSSVMGLDFATSVMKANSRKRSKNVQFVQADLHNSPIKDETFDLAYSIGVLHHTPNTRVAFDSVAKMVKPGGRLYIWLYRRPENFLGRMVKVPIYDSLRWIISRLPAALQGVSVQVYARLVRAFHRLRTGKEPIALREYLISAYDDLACRWRFYHHPIEIARWFHEAGFDAPTLSHWDNPFGFGMVARKRKQDATPGISYGDGTKLWDNRETVLGRLHKD